MRTCRYLTLSLATAVGFGGCADNTLKPEELTLKQNLGVLRELLIQFEADKQKYPESLSSLVTSGYLRKLPYDTLTRSNTTWIEVQTAGDRVDGVRSGAPGTASDGTRYFDW